MLGRMIDAKIKDALKPLEEANLQLKQELQLTTSLLMQTREEISMLMQDDKVYYSSTKQVHGRSPMGSHVTINPPSGSKSPQLA